MKILNASILGLVLALHATQPLFAAEPANTSPQLVPLKLVLPQPLFCSTPRDYTHYPTNIDLPSRKPRPLMMVPAGLTNIALHAKLTSSDKKASTEKLSKIIDGKKQGDDENFVYLRKTPQWVQMDFDKPQEIFAIAIWHATDIDKAYHDVIVQAADDVNMTQNVRTLFNNDQDNSSGVSVGTDREYVETCEGKLLDTKGIRASSLRFYSNGSTDSKLNEYIEIEVYGRPASELVPLKLELPPPAYH